MVIGSAGGGPADRAAPAARRRAGLGAPRAAGCAGRDTGRAEPDATVRGGRRRGPRGPPARPITITSVRLPLLKINRF